MINFLVFVAGILVGAIVVMALNRRAPHRPPGPRDQRPEDTAMGRDIDENAGGSRHIRTYPSWRDRFERRS
ncbi:MULTISPECIES: hypothetical protein [Nocardia]|uniref:hypothetical protein n=1 Tax=Nocardia TaxID=1817 RepID=UPI00082D2DE4|nr:MULTISPECIES: hypothetical protein [Nocardia]UFS95297.1 hypothetical protein LPY97_32155 [Nocardia huaxiensis]